MILAIIVFLFDILYFCYWVYHIKASSQENALDRNLTMPNVDSSSILYVSDKEAGLNDT
jgi:hypothetical protein